jgi:hypothetical protein
MLRYRLRTLLIVLALGPVVLAGAWWAWEQLRPRPTAILPNELDPYVGEFPVAEQDVLFVPPDKMIEDWSKEPPTPNRP